MKKNIIALVFALTLLIPNLVFAQAVEVDNTGGNTSGVVKLENKLNADTPQELIGIVIDAVLGIVGSLALLMFVFGGITWMTSSGSADKVKKGRDIIVWAAIGLVIVFSAYGLTRVLLEGVMK